MSPTYSIAKEGRIQAKSGKERQMRKTIMKRKKEGIASFSTT